MRLLTLAQSGSEATPLEQLDPVTRATLLMALVALVLTGLTLIGLTMIGARWVRRELRDRKPPRRWPSRNQLEARPPAEPPEVESDALGETLAGLPSDQDTRSNRSPDG